MDSNTTLASLRDAKNYFSHLPEDLSEYLDPAYQKAFDHLMRALDNFFDTIVTINIQASECHFISADEATHIGDEGFIIFLKLINLMEKLDLPHKRSEIEQVSLILARWVIRFGGKLNYIDPVVNGCARLANILNDKKALIELSTLMAEVSDACSIDIKQDANKDDDERPWKLLQLNRGIVATRTHDIDIMQRAFDEMLMYLPTEALSFFEKGMSEMTAMNYPAHVQALMQKYYEDKPSTIMH